MRTKRDYRTRGTASSSIECQPNGLYTSQHKLKPEVHGEDFVICSVIQVSLLTYDCVWPQPVLLYGFVSTSIDEKVMFFSGNDVSSSAKRIIDKTGIIEVIK